MVAQAIPLLKPRGIIELFDQAIRLYRSHFLKFIGIIAIAQVPVQVVSSVLSVLFLGSLSSLSSRTGAPAPTDPTQFYTIFSVTMVVAVIVLIVSFILVTGIATAALTRAISDSYLGQEITVGGSYARTRSAWGRLLGAMLLLGLLNLAALIWTIVPCIGWFTGLGVLIYLALVIGSLIAPIVIVEDLSGFKAIRRAWDLTRHYFWKAGAFFLLLTLFNFLVIQVPVQIVNQVIGSFISAIIGGLQVASLYTIRLIVSSILGLLLGLLYLPLQSICATLIYFDMRIRQEGLDLAMLASQGSESPLAPVDLASQSAVSPAGPLVTWKEVGYFALVSLAVGALYTVLYVLLIGFVLAAGSLAR